jgi:hypothetical protein
LGVAPLTGSQVFVAQSPECFPGIKTGRMPVVPAQANRVIPYALHTFQREVGPQRGGVQDTLTGPFVATGRTWALTAKIMIGESGDRPVGPDQLKDLFRLVGSDVGGGLTHQIGSFRWQRRAGLFLVLRNDTSRLSFNTERWPSMERFYVKATSVNQVRRALGRAPGGARVVGRFDRETIECRHTMDAHSFSRHWPVILSRLERSGLLVVSRPGAELIPRTDEESPAPLR